MQKIVPFVWFDTQGEEAMRYYTSLFPNSKIVNTMPGPDGSFLSGTMELDGFEMMVITAGPQFKVNPSISFFVRCKTGEETKSMWDKLSSGGKVLMEYQKYPFAEKYGWCEDKYGVSWQVILSESDSSQRIAPSLLFTQGGAGKALEAAKFYVSLFPESKLGDVMEYPEGAGEAKGSVAYGEMKLCGVEISFMDSGGPHQFVFSEGVSLFVKCKDQAEVDSYWNALIADGGEESMCGWCKDKYGVWWQIIPDRLGELMGDSDRALSGRVMQAMLKMQKIDVKKLEDAARG